MKREREIATQNLYQFSCMLLPVFGHVFACVCEPHSRLTDRRTNKMMIIFLNKPKFVIGLSTSKVNIYRWLQNYHVSQMVIVCNIFGLFVPSALSLFLSIGFLSASYLSSFHSSCTRETPIWSLHVRVCVSFSSSLRPFFLFTWCVNCALHCMRVIFVDFIRFFIRTSQKRRKRKSAHARGEST